MYWVLQHKLNRFLKKLTLWQNSCSSVYKHYDINLHTVTCFQYFFLSYTSQYDTSCFVCSHFSDAGSDLCSQKKITDTHCEDESSDLDGELETVCWKLGFVHKMIYHKLTWWKIFSLLWLWFILWCRYSPQSCYRSVKSDAFSWEMTFSHQ